MQDGAWLHETVHSPTHTHACIASPSLGAHHTHTCRQFITSSLSLMLYYHLLLHIISYDITLDLCSCAVFHMFQHISLVLVMCNSLKSWSNRETRLFPLVVEVRVEDIPVLKKYQTTVSTTERYFTLYVVCLIVKCTRRQRKCN